VLLISEKRGRVEGFSFVHRQRCRPLRKRGVWLRGRWTVGVSDRSFCRLKRLELSPRRPKGDFLNSSGSIFHFFPLSLKILKGVTRAFAGIWFVFEPILFSLIGTEIVLSHLSADLLMRSLAIIFTALIVRLFIPLAVNYCLSFLKKFRSFKTNY